MGRPPETVTFGCRLNFFESEVLRRQARAAGAEDLVIFNSCAVTAEAERQVRQAIRSVRRRRPEATIVVTGCAAQIAPERFAAMPEVDRVVGNAEKLRAETWAGASEERVVVSDVSALRETAGHLRGAFEGRTRAFLRVQDGCDHRCTFCVIPLARGPSRSVAVESVVEQARVLVGDGVREIVLTGVDLTAYEAGGSGLGELVAAILERVPGLPRLRLSSLDPSEIDPTLWRLLGEEPRLMPHLHLSLQAGDDEVLRRMGRRHRRAGALECAARARELRPDVALGADLIAGFPGESERAFARTLSLIDECGLVYVHAFPYSPRPGTAAAGRSQMPRRVRSERAALLREAGARARARFLAAKIGRRIEVLVEGEGRIGRAPDFAEVALDGEARTGELVEVTPVALADGRLVAAAS